jgi:hypothetical protein
VPGSYAAGLRHFIMKGYPMIKVSMRFVLLSALSLAAMVQQVYAAAPGHNSSVELTKISFEGNDCHMLNVTQLSKPESRMIYDEIGTLLAASTDPSEGITTFNGTTIEVNIPPQAAVAGAAHVIISTPDCGRSRATMTQSVAVKRSETSLSAWLNGGALPTVQHQPLGRHNISTQTGKPVAKAKSAGSGSGRLSTGSKGKATFGSHRR